MPRRPVRPSTILVALFALAGLLVPAASGAPQPPRRATAQPSALSLFGLNGYFTGYERPPSEVTTLLPMGPAIGVRWTREEVVWANIETSPDSFNFSHYDTRFRDLADAGYGIIGMLLTTPGWARRSACSGSYWCPPANVWDYGDFVQRTVERYDGDGYLDAPGSPRVAYWEIWNEPNFPQTWGPYGMSEAQRQAAYGDLLHAGYASVKAADPTAKVIVGSVYVWDGATYPAPVYDGLAWLGQVQYWYHQDLCSDFDILGIHPHMPEDSPDNWDQDHYLISMMGRLDNALKWDTEPLHECPGERPVFVTEVAWSTCTGCGRWAKTQDQQANYLLRTYALAAARGIPHVSVFQLEDKFNGGPGDTWGNCSIVTLSYTPKKAYYALGVMADQLEGAAYVGPGPAMGGGTMPRRYDYQFRTPAGDYVDVIWRVEDDVSEWPAFLVKPGYQPFWVTRDGVKTALAPDAGGYVYPPVTGAPGYLRQERPAVLALSTNLLGWLAEPGETPPSQQVYLTNAGGGTLNWTAYFANGGEYFSLEPTSGTAPSILTLSPQPQSATGFYTATVNIDGGPAGHANIWMWMWVLPSLHRTYLPFVGVKR